MLSSACTLGVRGAVHTTPDTVNLPADELLLQGQVYVPYQERMLLLGTVTNAEVSAGIAFPIKLFNGGDALVAPQANVVWRHQEEAFGAELGGRLHVWKAVVEAGVQHTVGDTGRTGVFGAIGLDIFRLCGCL